MEGCVISFFGSLFGSDQEKALRKGKKASDAELQAGYDQSQPFYQQSFDLYQPYATSGTKANTAYGDALGLNGREAQVAAEDSYFNDPAQQRVLEQNSNALLRQMNARGGSYGGRAILAGGRLATEGYNSFLDRLKGFGETGLAATGAQSALRSGQGDLRYSLGLTKAGQETNFSNAIAANKSTGINNLLSIAGLGVKAYAASDIRLKRDITPDGHLPSGLPVYTFRYIWSDELHRGVMAQEAMEFFPDAVASDAAGYLMVDYNGIR